MVRLLVIADDFTGALDTGVQFRTGRPLVMIFTGGLAAVREALAQDSRVLVIDAETRHLAPEAAYDIVFGIVKLALEEGVPYVYKKTDSGLRGNIGSELTALWKASGNMPVHFFPAFPRMGRITRGGVHYIDGVPVAESMFGRDLFEPVRHSAVKDIIAEQSSVPVAEGNRLLQEDTGALQEETGALQDRDEIPGSRQEAEKSSGESAGSDGGILVYDSTSDEEMLRLGGILKDRGELRLMAGCAGFAAVLFRLLGFRTESEEITVASESSDPLSAPERHLASGSLLVICGSISAVTVSQLDYASERGTPRVALKAEEKLTEGWAESEAGLRRIRSWEEILRESGALIAECGVKDAEETLRTAAEAGLGQEEMRTRIAKTMGEILKRMLDDGVQSTLLVTGGDTLFASMKAIGCSVLKPVRELFPGVVLSRLEYRGKTYDLISKSGGFGQEDLILRLKDMLMKEGR